MADVLVVEDDGSIRGLLELVLADLGHDARIATNAEDALLACAEHRPDLLVLDLGLPERDGDELLALLARGIGRPRSLLIVSARPAHDVRAVAAANGARHLTKPFDIEQLEQEVVAALEEVAAREAVPADADHEDGAGVDVERAGALGAWLAQALGRDRDASSDDGPAGGR